MQSFTDIELVQKTLARPNDYSGIIERYEEAITRYVRRLVIASDEEVQELVQDIFIKAYRSLNSYNQSLKFTSWLYRIAHNCAVDYLRKNSKRTHASLDAEDDESQALLECIASDEDVHLTLAKDLERQAVRAIIAQLPEKYREVLVLFYLEEKRYEEISDILQMPVNTVGTMVHRAKKQFIVLAQKEEFRELF